MAEIAYVYKLPICNFCEDNTPATHDVKTKYGPWASVCDNHRNMHAATMALGTGLGQRYVVGEPPVVTADERRAKVREALEANSMSMLEDAVGDGDIADWL